MPITYEFDELPLLRSGDFAACEIREGSAEIEYDDAGDWWVTDISFMAIDRVNGRWGRATKRITLDRRDPLFELISNALSRECTNNIADRIVAHMDDEGVPRPRSDYDQHNTYRVVHGRVA